MNTSTSPLVSGTRNAYFRPKIHVKVDLMLCSNVVVKFGGPIKAKEHVR